jgi:protein gp37
LAHVPAYKGLATIQTEGSLRGQRHVRWNGQVRFLPERLEEPLHWKKPRRIFVCDMGDLFHESVSNEWLSRVMTTILKCHQHTFQILTKRPERMAEWFKLYGGTNTLEKCPGYIAMPDGTKYVEYCAARGSEQLKNWPLPNVWLGVSVENQVMADKRIPLLLDTPAAVRFVSAEPLLGPVDFGEPIRQWCRAHQLEDRTTSLDWIIAGGESGPHARPMHPDWPRAIRDWCQQRGVPFFFKQWGEFAPIGTIEAGKRTFVGTIMDGQMMLRYGKKLSGRLLDGKEWNEFPVPAS